MTGRLIILEQLYRRIKKPLENVIFPLVLLLWPLVKVAQGVDVSDSTYSLGNYLFSENLDGVWVISTYLSNLIGAGLVRLPGGMTLYGMNIYTGLIVSLIALICYFCLKEDFTAPVMFAGEFIAISFCWIPTGILYNYITYLLFSLGAILLYKAVRYQKLFYLFVAGIVLGLNVFVRIPNLAEMALILVVWGCLIFQNESEKIVKNTMICIGGYTIGVAIPLIIILARFGIAGIMDMISGLSSMSTSNNDYTLGSMILATIKAYINSSKWLLIVLAVIFAGTLVMAALKNNKTLKNMGRMGYLGIVIVMLRFFWGRGMFSFRYYEDYTSMYEWGMLVLFLGWICAITVLVRSSYNILVKCYAIITLVMLVITPLGSNNYTCQNLNNMFLVMPFIIYTIAGWLNKGSNRLRLTEVLCGCNFPWMSTVIAIMLVVIAQTTLFHINFVFRDGMDGSPRKTEIIGIDSLEGMYTNEENAVALIGLNEYFEKTDRAVSGAVFWGDCPGLAYILRLPSAISTSWTDLDSYATEIFDRELQELSVDSRADETVVIWRKLDAPSGNNGMEKQDILLDYIASKKLSVDYENNEYIVYR